MCTSSIKNCSIASRPLPSAAPLLHFGKERFQKRWVFSTFLPRYLTATFGDVTLKFKIINKNLLGLILLSKLYLLFKLLEGTLHVRRMKVVKLSAFGTWFAHSILLWYLLRYMYFNHILQLSNNPILFWKIATLPLYTYFPNQKTTIFIRF